MGLDPKKKYRFETLGLHAGQEPDAQTLSRGIPVHRTTSYVFKNTQHAADLFALKEMGNIYTRIMNPTQDMLERRVAALEGGAAALALASGTSAIFNAVINLARTGDEIVSANNLYGGTYTMFDAILPQFGIKTRFVRHDRPEEIRAAMNSKTRALFVETIGNPVLDVADLKSLADLAHEHGVPLIVDATFTTPWLLRPFDYGADIVVHSLTKWLGGHGAAVGGIAVDSGRFDWSDERFALFNEPDPNYHGMRWAHDLGDLQNLAYILRMRTVPLRNLGAAISPDNAWIFMQGIETLPLRMERHCRNALATAQHLQQHPAVEWVRYPGLPDDPSHAMAARYLQRGFGGMVVFGIKGGYDAAVKFIDNVTLFSHLANVGDARSLVLHPASTSHSQLSEEAQMASGLSPDLIRLSIGLEHIDDILEALDTALTLAT